MPRLLTPKQVARAIGVSESTLKRWCDSGRIPVVRTSGGHRRMRQGDILNLAHQGKIPFENPAALDLPPAAGKGEWTLCRASAEVTSALVDGDYLRLQQVALDLFLCGHKLASICDAVLTPAFVTLGERWVSGELEIYEERRAVGMAARLIHSMHELLREPDLDAPVAVGGAPSGDHHTLPNLMVELALREAGWRATSLGGPLPFPSLRTAMIQQAPRLFWISVCDVEDEETFLEEFADLFDACPRSTALVVGGRALTMEMRRNMRFTTFCANLTQLCDFATVLQPLAALKVAQP